MGKIGENITQLGGSYSHLLKKVEVRRLKDVQG